MNKEYYLGLDIGTNSVGWAVTDKEYNLCQFKNKDMWGIHLFDEAKTAADRRVKRTARRRLKRRKQRIQLLQELFAEEMAKKDSEFFIKLNESKLVLEDKSVKIKHPLFSDPDFTDIDYYKRYPTIYHLRSELIHDEKPHDVREVYLAIHHILKNRGHFLVEGNLEAATDFYSLISNISESFNNYFSGEVLCEIDKDNFNKIEVILRDSKKAASVRAKEMTGLIVFSFPEMDKALKKKCDNASKEITKLLVGNQADINKLFVESGYFDDEELPKIKFSAANYDEQTEPELQEKIPEEMIIINAIKAVYDWSLLVDILQGQEFFSDAKIQSYNTHKDNLILLHTFMKKYCSGAVCKDFFDAALPKKANYSNYVGHIKKNGKDIRVSKCNEEDFYKNLKSILTSVDQKQFDDQSRMVYEKLLVGAENKSLLPLQRSKDNAVVPKQVHEKELRTILKNAKAYLPFLSEKDEKGKTVADKVIDIFNFRIPYYVGPLGGSQIAESNSWMIRKSGKEEEHIYPWNFDEIVDREASNEQFIRRMTNKCTYLYGEDVLPKQSILYSKYMVLNELNNLTIRGKSVCPDTKKAIYNDLFMKRPKVTGKQLLTYLKKDDSELELSDLGGFDIDFKSSLSSYIAFRDNVFGEAIEEDENMKIAEDIIKWATIYGDDKKMLIGTIEKAYPGKFDDNQIKAIKRMRFTGWGNFSRRFLEGINGVSKDDGVVGSIIDMLWDTNNNLMQLLSQQFTFSEQIREMNQKITGVIETVSYDELIKGLFTSPANKRAIWRTIKIVEEIRKVQGEPPKKIFVEMARGGEKNKTRKASRKQKLLDLYAACESDVREWIEEIEGRDEREFNSIKLYLYYTQMGKCAYTGNPIDLEQLMNGSHKWDRDHIYPQSKIKDDSIDNLVLVERVENAKKDNGMISESIQCKMRPVWKAWLRSGFISKSKYDRLTRREDFSNDELAGFMNRQLVETRQSTKLVAELLEKLYPESRVVRVKAGLVSDFRKSPLKILKSRRVNDYHHAVDAYLNIVVGNVYNTRFTSNPIKWAKEHRDDNWSINKVFYYDVKGAWKAPDLTVGKDGKKHAVKNEKGEICTGSIDTVRRMIQKRKILYTEYSYCATGQLFDETLQTHSDKKLIPLKKDLDTSKYGGYTSANTSYFALIEFDGKKKGERVKNIVGVPIYIDNMLANDPSAFVKYCTDVKGLANVKVIKERIKKNALIVVEGFPMRIRGENEKDCILKGNLQPVFGEQDAEAIRSIEKWLEKGKDILISKEHDGISEEDLIHLYDTFIVKHETIYKKRPSNQLKALLEGKEHFINLSNEEKAILLNNIQNLLLCDAETTADLRLIKKSSSVGRMVKNKNTMLKEKTYLVNQSVTGLFSTKERL